MKIVFNNLKSGKIDVSKIEEYKTIIISINDTVISFRETSNKFEHMFNSVKKFFEIVEDVVKNNRYDDGFYLLKYLAFCNTFILTDLYDHEIIQFSLGKFSDIEWSNQ